MLARVRLQALVSAYGWALWGAIQSAASDLDFDFDGWSREHFEKAARGFTADGFDALLRGGRAWLTSRSGPGSWSSAAG